MQRKSKAGLKPRDLKMGAIRDNGEIFAAGESESRQEGLTLAWATFVCRHIKIAEVEACDGNLLLEYTCFGHRERCTAWYERSFQDS